jgi:hypothetical protein
MPCSATCHLHHHQAELRQAQEDAAAVRAGSEDVASLQEQLAAAREEASGLRNSNEDVDYLQAQLRRTLRDNVELRHQVGLLVWCDTRVMDTCLLA